MVTASRTPDPFAGPSTGYRRDPWTTILIRSLDARIAALYGAGTLPPAPPTPFPDDDAEEAA